MDRNGFTLIEVLLSVGILALLIGVSLPVYETFVRRNDLDLATQNVVSALRRAATNARGVQNDSIWGVSVQSSSITLFKGSTYATRDTTFDETVTMPGSITSSGLAEVSFAKLTGVPTTTGSINLSSTTSSSKTIAINAEGMVDY